jgi:hypothetical protein
VVTDSMMFGSIGSRYLNVPSEWLVLFCRHGKASHPWERG